MRACCTKGSCLRTPLRPSLPHAEPQSLVCMGRGPFSHTRKLSSALMAVTCLFSVSRNSGCTQKVQRRPVRRGGGGQPVLVRTTPGIGCFGCGVHLACMTCGWRRLEL